jgi:hypothetical protein
MLQNGADMMELATTTGVINTESKAEKKMTDKKMWNLIQELSRRIKHKDKY